MCILGANGGWALLKPDSSYLPQRHTSATCQRNNHLLRNRFGRTSQTTWVADVDTVTFAPFDSCGNSFAAQRHGNRVLYLIDRQAIPGKFVPHGFNHQKVAATDAFGKGARRPRNLAKHLLNLTRRDLDICQRSANNLHAHRCADPRRQHVDPGFDRHGPGIADAWKLKACIHLGDQLVHRHSGAPFTFRFQVDNRLEHFQWRRIRCRCRTSSLAEN